MKVEDEEACRFFDFFLLTFLIILFSSPGKAFKQTESAYEVLNWEEDVSWIVPNNFTLAFDFGFISSSVNENFFTASPNMS